MDVGLTIVEGVANGASPFKEPSKRNIGLLGQFVRGAELTPTKITSLEDFNVIFGGQSSSFYGPGFVRSIFKEAGTAPVTLYLARVVGSGSKVAEATVGIGTSESGIGVSTQQMVVRAGYKGADDPGAWANGITAKLYSYGSRVKDMFTLVVAYGSATETYNYASLSEIQNAVNRVSKYITIEFSGEINKLTFNKLTGTITCSTSSNVVTGSGTRFTSSLKIGDVIYADLTSRPIGTVVSVKSDTELTLSSKALYGLSGGAAKARLDTIYTATLTNGIDGEVVESDFYPVKSTAKPLGLACFDGFDVQILAVTEFHSLEMAKRMNAYLEEWGNPIGVINLPLNADEGTAELFALELQTNGRSFLAGAYMGWVKVPDDNGNAQLLPAIAPILGAAYIRTPYVNGDFIHIPPGGIDSLFNYVTEVLPARLSQAVINRCVQQFSCNILQYVENTGYYVGSSRTYSTNALYSSVHIRQQTSYYLRALLQKMHFMEQKPNTPELKREALVELNRFFRTEYDNGALERSVDFDTAYQGICDASNNPPTQDRKLVNIDVMWIPTECTESVAIALKRNDGILTTMEV